MNRYQGPRKRRESVKAKAPREGHVKATRNAYMRKSFLLEHREKKQYYILSKQFLWIEITSLTIPLQPLLKAPADIRPSIHITPLFLFNLNPTRLHLPRTHHSRPPMLHPQPFLPRYRQEAPNLKISLPDWYPFRKTEY